MKYREMLLPVRVNTVVTCNKCLSELTESFGAHWSCKLCDCWVLDVTTTQKPYELFTVTT